MDLANSSSQSPHSRRDEIHALREKNLPGVSEQDLDQLASVMSAMVHTLPELMLLLNLTGALVSDEKHVEQMENATGTAELT